MNIWFSSDWHLSHSNIIRYCNRPFSSIQEMDDTILKNFFDVVENRDEFYYLGDLSFNREIAREFFNRALNKQLKIHFVFGNHDNKIRDIIRFYSAYFGDMLQLDIDNTSITMTHFAMRVWNKSHFNSWNLYGHSHATLPPEGKQWDVGVDNNSFKPLHFEEVKKIMSDRPDNFNYIKQNA